MWRNRLIVALVFLLFCGHSARATAALAYDSSVSGATATTYTFNNVAGDILFVGCENVAGSIPSGITYNGVALTKVGDQAILTSEATLWMLVAPATGSHSVVVTGAGGYFASLSVSYSGSKATGQPDGSNTGTAASGSLSVSATTSVSNDWTVGLFVSTSGVDLTPAAGSTKRIVDAGFFNGGIVDSNGPLSAGSNSLGVTDTRTWAGIVVGFQPIGGVAPSSTQSLSLTGVGPGQ